MVGNRRRPILQVVKCGGNLPHSVQRRFFLEPSLYSNAGQWGIYRSVLEGSAEFEPQRFLGSARRAPAG